MSNSWIAVYTDKRGGEVRFPLFEGEHGKLFLKISGEAVPFKIGINSAEHGRLIHLRTERSSESEKAPLRTEEKI
jgi:hypothetical protein